MPRPPISIAAAAALASLAIPRIARAGDPADAEVTARLIFLERALEREEPAVRTWSHGWTAGYGGLVIAQAAMAMNAPDASARAASILGSAKSAVGLAARIVLPLTATSAATRLRAIPSDTPAARRAKLGAAERLLAQSAADERFGRSWVPLIIGAALNLSGAFILFRPYRATASGWFGLLSGTAVSQLQFWTQPTGAITAWSAYTRGAWRSPEPRRPSVSWSLLPAANGFLAGCTF